MRMKIFFGTLLLLMLTTATLFAQVDNPCTGDDPDGNCPLDSWVIVFAAVALVLAALHLHRKQSAQKTKLS